MTVYYVSSGGSDSGNGSAGSPFRTITKAMQSKLKPGDEVVVKAGTYAEKVVINKSGSADGGYITVRAEVPGTVKIAPPPGKDAAIVVLGNYLKVDGFEVTGATAGITAMSVHHVEITNNLAHNNIGNGISVNRSEFILVEGNVSHDNAKEGARQGISIFHSENVSGDTTTTGPRIIVRNNLSYNNRTENGATTDCNGIIIDSNNSPNGGYPDYPFETLVEGNLVHGNGGAGIALAWSDNVTVVNNTSYHNHQDPGASAWSGEISNTGSSHNTFVNNIAVADGSVRYAAAFSNNAYRGELNTDLVWMNNLTYNGTPGQASLSKTTGNAVATAADGNLLGVDPKFVNPAAGDFHLQSTSPAIGKGLSSPGTATVDMDGEARVIGGSIDLGADEATAPTPPEEPTPENPTDTGGKVIVGLAGNDRLVGTAGADTMNGNGGNDTLTGGAGNDTMSGAAGNDSLMGSNGADSMMGGAGDDRLIGGAGSDILKGGDGNEVLLGGAGSDTLSGSTGADRFVFTTAAEANGDVMTDYWRTQGDRIDLGSIDANTTIAGNQAFSFIADKAFGGTAGQLRYKDGIIAGDLNGDNVADFQLTLADGHWLGAADFIL